MDPVRKTKPSELPRRPIPGKGWGYVRAFNVLHYKDLLAKFPDGMVPFKPGLTLNIVADVVKGRKEELSDKELEALKEDLKSIGFSHAALNIRTLKARIATGNIPASIHFGPRETGLKPGTEEYVKANFDAYVGRFCNPENVLVPIEVEEVVRRKDMKLSNKGLMAVDFMKKSFPDPAQVQERGRYVGRLAKELPIEPNKEQDEQNRWRFIASVCKTLYDGPAQGQNREKFIMSALSTLYPADISSVIKATQWMDSQEPT